MTTNGTDAERTVASVHVGKALRPRFEQRVRPGAGHSKVAGRDLLRYYEIIESALPEALRALSEDEVLLLGRLLYKPWMAGVLKSPYLVTIAEDMLGEQGGNGDLMVRLRGLHHAEVAALLDHLEQHWMTAAKKKRGKAK